MKRLVAIISMLVVCLGTSALATPTIEFSPNPDTAGNWSYDGAGILSFDQDISVGKALSSNYDALVGSLVYIPTFNVSAIGDGTYDLAPLGDPTISITSADGSSVYLTGTLKSGNLVPVGTIGAAYTQFQSDIINIQVTTAGELLGSAALDAIVKSGTWSLDFELALLGASGTKYISLSEMIEGGYSGGNGFSAAMTIPEPTTIALLGLSSIVFFRKRRA
jgi:hypothetical protein